MPVYAGIDYSLTSPAICVYNAEDGDFCFDNVQAYFRSNLKRFELFKEGNLHGENHESWDSEMDRFDDIASWALDVMMEYKVEKAFLEGYSFGSTGRVFNIAENTSILKYNMWYNYIEYEIVAPTTVKKFATGSGNATKEKMYEAFVEENPRRDIKDVLTPRSSNIISPLNDVVDSYFILKYGIYNEEQEEKNKDKRKKRTTRS